ncbi:cardiolipin synthase [Tenacibaculum jejuense]|uniref:Cardiolipin synthase n=1 Tax=Tenacibaculum jejuense TaxID=584609 RepID=A0A238U4E3_9FLAO|nr:cardiolipin synthase [Tenacibaculum jejuense]SNR13915.1 Phospholipase D/Transphosphatidylase [Tenacibaculum jejuense]
MILLYIIYVLGVIWSVFNILLYGNRPARSIGWLLIVITIPIIGVIFYIIFGINRKKFKFFTLNFNAKRRLYDLRHKGESIENFSHKFNSEKFAKLGHLMKKSSGFPAVEGNKVSVLDTGKNTFEEIFKEVSNAKKFIHIQYYIIEEGELLSELIKRCKQKLKEGVEVRILYDAIGSNNLRAKQIKDLKNCGAEIFPILPIKLNTILSTLNYRNHRKILVIDGTVCFTGGVNISDKYVNENTELGIWDDFHLKIEGIAVDHLHRVFIKDFYFASNKELLNDTYLPNQSKKGNSLVQIVAGGPDLKYSSILQQYTMMIHCAQKSVCIENPYFIPNKILLETIKMAVLRGVDVKIMVPEKNDSRIAKYSMYANFEDLLETGAKIYTLKNNFSHSKLIVIDEEIASIGSGNFDYRSFEHNYEINTILYDQKIAKNLSDHFKSNMSKCNALNYDTYMKRSLKTKLLEGAAKILSPLL